MDKIMKNGIFKHTRHEDNKVIVETFYIWVYKKYTKSYIGTIFWIIENTHKEVVEYFDEID